MSCNVVRVSDGGHIVATDTRLHALVTWLLLLLLLLLLWSVPGVVVFQLIAVVMQLSTAADCVCITLIWITIVMVRRGQLKHRPVISCTVDIKLAIIRQIFLLDDIFTVIFSVTDKCRHFNMHWI